MEQSILTWNVPNFVSVSLMAILFAVLFAFATKAIRTQNS